MGTYGFGPRIPPLPGQPAPHYGPRYGSPQPPEGLVPFKTPVVNQLVQGINEFVGNFRGVQDAEKQRAREQALDNIRMATELGLNIDMKKTARLLRKGGIDLNYDAIPGQTGGPPIPGAPSPQQMQAAQQFSAAGMIGGPQAIAGAMAAGAPMPGQGGAPIPGARGGGNFFQRFGRAISDPFRNEPPFPEKQGTIVEALQRLQAMGASRQQVEAAQLAVGQAVGQAMQTFVGGEVGSPEWMRSTQLLYSLDKVKELPMEYKVRELQRLAGVKDEREAARLIYAAENINLPGGPNPDAERNAMSFVNAFMRSHQNGDPSKIISGYRKMLAAKSDDELFEIDWGLGDGKDDQETQRAIRSEFDKLHVEHEKAPRAALWTAATHIQAGEMDAADQVLKEFGPSRSAQEADRQRARDAREQTRFAQDQSEQQISEQVEDYANRLFQEARGDISTAIRKLSEYQYDINAPWQYRSLGTRIRERLEDIARGGGRSVDVRVSAVPPGPAGSGGPSTDTTRRLEGANR